MTMGEDVLSGANAKLDWAARHNAEMQRRFEEFVRESDRGTPYAIEFRESAKPAGHVVARFRIERAIPVEVALLAADTVHNTRVALDHVLARLKDVFGGDSGQGSFPVCQTRDDWEARVADRRRSPLQGLEDTSAWDLIFEAQPMHQENPEADPLVVVNALDNADKHRLFQVAFAYPSVDHGLDLIERVEPRAIAAETSRWERGEALDDRTVLATFMVRGPVNRALRARDGADLIGCAIGDPRRARRSFDDLIERVRAIAAEAAQIIDEHES